MVHKFEILAPALGYVRRLFVVHHDAELVYPCGISGEGVPGSPTAATQEHLEKILGQTFQSPEVVSVIQSLIAKTNEVQFPVPPQPTEPPVQRTA
jgi:hypothetical protein